MSSRRRKRGGHGGAEVHNDERWAVSYMDMITVCFLLFVMLYATSQTDAAKYEQLRNSLATGFGNEEVGKLDLAEGVIAPPDQEGEEETMLTDLQLAEQEVADLEAVQKRISDALAAQGKSNTVRFEIDERGLTVRLVSSDTFFQVEDADLTGEAMAVLDVIGPVLSVTPYEVSVEGHADHKATRAYPTNWELASARATQVVRHMVDHGGVKAGRVAAVGFGSARPLKDGGDASALAMNRRVDIVVLSDEPEVVRALIPEVMAAAKTKT